MLRKFKLWFYNLRPDLFTPISKCTTIGNFQCIFIESGVGKGICNFRCICKFFSLFLFPNIKFSPH